MHANASPSSSPSPSPSLLGRIQARSASWSRLAIVFSTYALVVGAASFALYLPDALDGETPAVVRAALGVLGFSAGVVLWTRPTREVLGWRLALLWALAQIPVIAWSEYGSATLQLIEIPLSFTERTTVNGEVTSYSEFGINIVGIALAAIYAKLQGQAVIKQG
jgi:hypothetical protein